MSATEKAPCVAVVGPANSGKTDLLHVLDEILQHHPSRPLVYVVKGNPDGSGRYLYYSPRLRKELKDQVKGVWTGATVESVCLWVDNARDLLELALLDFGGKHESVNDAMLSRCSHYIVMARRFPDEVQEKREGMESWQRVCEKNGLAPLALIHSLYVEGEPQILSAGHPLWMSFRSDIVAPGDLTNQHVLEALVDRLLEIRRPKASLPYIDLRLSRDWTPSDLADLAGLLPRMESLARQRQRIVLGGRAPVWAYVACMHRILDVDPSADVWEFDPKGLSENK
jgi:energy-coupling factor transporter ATP-binding protein EcfA2